MSRTSLRRYTRYIDSQDVPGLTYDEELSAVLESHEPGNSEGSDIAGVEPADVLQQFSEAGQFVHVDVANDRVRFYAENGSFIEIDINATNINFYNPSGLLRGSLQYNDTDQLNLMGGDSSNRSRVDVKSDRVTFRLKGTAADGSNGTIADLVLTAASGIWLDGVAQMNDLVRIAKLMQTIADDVTFPGSNAQSNERNVTFSGFGVVPTGVVGCRGAATVAAKVHYTVYNLTSTSATVRGRTIDESLPSNGTTAPFSLSLQRLAP